MHTANPPPSPGHQASAVADARPGIPQQPASVQSADLLKGQKTVSIEHNGTVYRLQTTKTGKLILTK